MMKKIRTLSICPRSGKTLKTEKNLNYFRAMLTKVTVEAALNTDLDNHLGYARL